MAARRSSPRDRPNPYFRLRRSAIQGRGAIAIRRIPRFTRIIEYTGERITHEEADARYDDLSMKRHHTFLFTVNTRMVIDAAHGGNAARFINHSCEPNCEPIIVGHRVFIRSNRVIEPGEELSYDYNYEREEDDDAIAETLYACRCGSRRCRRTILSPRSPR